MLRVKFLRIGATPTTLLAVQENPLYSHHTPFVMPIIVTRPRDFPNKHLQSRFPHIFLIYSARFWNKRTEKPARESRAQKLPKTSLAGYVA
jgi:hypothetical protein